jgi:hypothetical protein
MDGFGAPDRMNWALVCHRLRYLISVAAVRFGRKLAISFVNIKGQGAPVSGLSTSKRERLV